VYQLSEEEKEEKLFNAFIQKRKYKRIKDVQKGHNKKLSQQFVGQSYYTAIIK